ncbi:MAG: PAS and helix-turn-helix domain-containing protein [Solirubrobacteraceae bacterium]
MAANTSRDDGWRGLFSFVFARSGNPLVLLDRERQIVEVNGAFLELLGYDREELIGRRIDGFFSPEEWRSLDAGWRVFLRRGDIANERVLIRSDGGTVVVQYAVRWTRVDGRGVALAVALHAESAPLAVERPGGEPEDLLTPRELDVIGLVAMGLRGHEVAQRLGIAESTVRSHVRNAMRKSGARSQAQLVAIVCTGRLLEEAVAA